MWDSLKSWLCGLCYKQNCRGNVGWGRNLEDWNTIEWEVEKRESWVHVGTNRIGSWARYLHLVSVLTVLNETECKSNGLLTERIFRKQPLVRGMVIFSCFQPGFQWDLGIKGRAGGCEKHSVWQENERVRRRASRSRLSKRLVIVKRSWAVYTGTVGERALKAVHEGARQNPVTLSRPTPEPHSSSLSCTSIEAITMTHTTTTAEVYGIYCGN